MLSKIKKFFTPKEDFEELLPYNQHIKNPLLNKNKENILPNDIFILSYPRSGNTWLRLMISDVLLSIHNIDTTNLSPEGEGQDILFKVSPTITKVDLTDYTNSPTGFRIIKTHNCSDFENNKFIYIYRDPTDAIVSYFRFKKKRALVPEDQDELIEFTKNEIRGWRDHLRTAIKKPNGLFIKFEELHKNPEKTLKKVLSYINIKTTDSIIKNAVINQNIINQRNRINKNSSSYKLASGKINDNKNKLPSEIKKFTEKYTRRTLKKINAKLT